ncbi:MAG: hypothetical protein IID40_07140, partial [Planctomycetes bacterium]|nr:hypothetical protein [Planctomycetota bacterium]
MSGANAGIVSVTGPIEVLPTPPASVAPGALATNGLIHAFVEREAVQLGNDLVVNILQPGSTTTYHPDRFDLASVDPGVLPAGTTVNCYLFHHNPATGAMTIGPGTVTFSERILGLILFPDDLDATDAALGAPGTVYGPYTGNRGLGTNASYPDDVLTLSGDGHTLTIDNLWTSGPILVDQLR